MNTVSPTTGQIGSPRTNLNAYALFVACATFLLLIAGGLVTSTGSGLAVPDWPLSFGQLFPKMEGGVLYEHGHRLIAGTVGILTFILAGWLWKSGAPRNVRLLGLYAAAAVVLQAVLGGVTVLYRLPHAVSVAHACLGQIFFCLVVSIAVLTGPPPTVYLVGPALAKLKRLGILTAVVIFLQLIAGALLRHTGKALHPHLLGAALVTIHIPLLSRRVLRDFRDPVATLWAAILPILLAGQLILGFISWRTGPVLVTTMHLAVGALLLAGTVAITVQASRS